MPFSEKDDVLFSISAHMYSLSVRHFNTNGARGRIAIKGDRSSTSKIISTRLSENAQWNSETFWNGLVGPWHHSRVHWPSFEQKSRTESLSHARFVRNNKRPMAASVTGDDFIDFLFNAYEVLHDTVCRNCELDNKNFWNRVSLLVQWLTNLPCNDEHPSLDRVWRDNNFASTNSLKTGPFTLFLQLDVLRTTFQIFQRCRSPMKRL